MANLNNKWCRIRHLRRKLVVESQRIQNGILRRILVVRATSTHLSEPVFFVEAAGWLTCFSRLPAGSLTHFCCAPPESTCAANHWRFRGAGTRHPPRCSQSPIHFRPPAHRRIRKDYRLLPLAEQFHSPPTYCIARESNEMHRTTVAPGREWLEYLAELRVEWLRAWDHNFGLEKISASEWRR